MDLLEYLVEMLYPWVRENSLLVATLWFWIFFVIGVCLKNSLCDKGDNVYYAKSRDIMDLRCWCWVNYTMGVVSLVLYLYKLNWG